MSPESSSRRFLSVKVENACKSGRNLFGVLWRNFDGANNPVPEGFGPPMFSASTTRTFPGATCPLITATPTCRSLNKRGHSVRKDAERGVRRGLHRGLMPPVSLLTCTGCLLLTFALHRGRPRQHRWFRAPAEVDMERACSRGSLTSLVDATSFNGRKHVLTTSVELSRPMTLPYGV